MKSNPNLLLAWLWILLGFVSGMVLGLFFRGEDWLGGYASFKRRMYRLGHISFFGLGALNLLFWLTVQHFSLAGQGISVASWAFIVGAIAMPICCVIMASFPKAHLIFSVPVVSLILGGALTLTLLVQAPKPTDPANTALRTSDNPKLRNTELGSSVNPQPRWLRYDRSAGFQPAGSGGILPPVHRFQQSLRFLSTIHH
jgi:hypothetical protein